MRNAFCERNLKPVFALLVALVAATIVWAAVIGGKAAGSPGFQTSASSVEPSGPVGAGGGRPGKDAGARGSTGDAGTIPGAAGTRRGGAAPSTNGTGPAVDAVSAATPGGGINVIRQPAAPSPPVGPGAPNVPARMQLVAAPRPGGGAALPGLPGTLSSAPGGAAVPGLDSRGRHAFNTVCSLILPTVVSIHAARSAPSIGVDPPEGPAEVRAGPAAPGSRRAVGSGFVIDSRGFVLTNRHVVAGASDIVVSVPGRIKREVPARVVATDPAADLALVRLLGAGECAEARLGDSRSARVGDWVLAFGSPFGLDQTVTQGIISGRREPLVVNGVSYGDMLQTDTPMNMGSSGGPLVNLKAEVIGVNAAIYGPGGAFSGTGFAIPASRAREFLSSCARILRR